LGSGSAYLSVKYIVDIDDYRADYKQYGAITVPYFILIVLNKSLY